MTTEYYERQLEPWEIEERTRSVLDLLGERDIVLSNIEQHKRVIKDKKVEGERLDARISDLRSEIRSGKVWEPRQTEFELEPAPGTLADEQGNPIEDPRDKPAKAPKKRRPRA